MRIAITGANSSVGKALLSHVLTQQIDDLEVRAGVRTQQAVTTLPAGRAVTPYVINYSDRDSLQAFLEGVNCVVHLAGILIESKWSSYETANVQVARAVVEACESTAVGHIVLVSAVGADGESSNSYYRSKGVAEEIAVQSSVFATIIRTPILLGPGTAGAKSLVGMASRSSVRILGGGQHTLRPLDVDDLSKAVMNCCLVRPDREAIHELVGPEAVTQRDLLAAVGQRMGHVVAVRTVPVWVVRLGATVIGMFRRGGMTPTVIDVITANETVGRNAAVDLGVTLTPLDATLEKLQPSEIGGQ